MMTSDETNLFQASINPDYTKELIGDFINSPSAKKLDELMTKFPAYPVVT